MYQHPSIQLELAKQRQADFLAEARADRLSSLVDESRKERRLVELVAAATAKLVATLAHRPAPRRAGLNPAS